MEFLNDTNHFLEQTDRRARLLDIWADLFVSVRDYGTGRYLRAEFVLQRIVKSLKQLAPGADLDEPWTRCLSNLAAVLARLGRADEAEACAFEGLAMCDDSFEPEVDGARVCLLNTLTRLYESQGRLTEAERRFLHSRAWDGGGQTRPQSCTSWSNAEIRMSAGGYVTNRHSNWRRPTEEEWPGAT